MARVILRPILSVDYGDVDTDGSGVVLGDGNNSTRKKYYAQSGSVNEFSGNFNEALIPSGRQVIAVRAAHRQINDLLVFNGWVESFLRINNQRQANTRAYKQDGYSGSSREIVGPALYDLNRVPWSKERIDSMGTESGSASGEVGPNRSNKWCICTESYIILVTDDDVAVPTVPYPAAGETIATSSVDFSARTLLTQDEQPIQTVFQVSRIATFDDATTKTFVGGLNASVDPLSRSYYVSEPGRDNFTDLGPGLWRLRIKNRDYRGVESAWSATTTFTITHAALPVPALITPAAGSTVATPYGKRTGRISATPAGERRVGIEWRFSKAADFSTGVVQWKNSSGGEFFHPKDISYDPTPNPSIKPGLNGPSVSTEDVAQYLSQGIWYGQARAADVYGQTGAWSAATTFTVAHKPVVSGVIPSGGASFDQATAPVRWSFSDPWTGDYQTAYQMIIRDGSDNILQNTGKVLSANARATMNIPSTWYNQIVKIAIDVWDADDVKSDVAFTSTFRLSHAPVITVTYPAADAAINNGQPNITWTAVFSRAGLTQKSFRHKFTRVDNGKVEFDSGVIVSTATSYLPPNPILKNLVAYQLETTIVDSEDLAGIKLTNFSTDFERPEFVQAWSESSGYSESGYVEVFWPTGNPDPFFMEWRVYRKKDSEPDDAWVLAGTVNDPSVKFFKDWLIAGNEEFVYTVTQAAYRFGSIVESEFDPAPLPFRIFSDAYWLIVKDREELNMRVYGVTADKFTDNRETAEYVIKGGGRRRAYGTRIGYSGNLTVAVRGNEMRTATQMLDDIRDICDNQYSLMMRTPFGNVMQIALGEISIDRMAGVGSQEFADLDIPYYEVF